MAFMLSLTSYLTSQRTVGLHCDPTRTQALSYLTYLQNYVCQAECYFHGVPVDNVGRSGKEHFREVRCHLDIVPSRRWRGQRDICLRRMNKTVYLDLTGLLHWIRYDE